MKIDLNNSGKEISRMAQERWKEIVEETGLEKLNLPLEMYSILRQYHELSYASGQADMFTQIQEIYHDDMDLFETMFDDTDLN